MGKPVGTHDAFRRLFAVRGSRFAVRGSLAVCVSRFAFGGSRFVVRAYRRRHVSAARPAGVRSRRSPEVVITPRRRGSDRNGRGTGRTKRNGLVARAIIPLYCLRVVAADSY